MNYRQQIGGLMPPGKDLGRAQKIVQSILLHEFTLFGKNYRRLRSWRTRMGYGCQSQTFHQMPGLRDENETFETMSWSKAAVIGY